MKHYQSCSFVLILHPHTQTKKKENVTHEDVKDIRLSPERKEKGGYVWRLKDIESK